MLHWNPELGVGWLEGQPVAISDVLVRDSVCHPRILKKINHVCLETHAGVRYQHAKGAASRADE